MKKCTKCKLLLDESKFYKDKYKPNGLEYACKSCEKVRISKHNKRYSDKMWVKLHRLKISLGGCKYCGEREPICLDFHHTDKSTKISTVAALARDRNWNKAFEEAQKCILLCANCHRRLHSGLIDLDKSISDENWGYHLLVDLGGCDNNINDMEYVKAFIQRLVKILDMHPIGAPVVVHVDSEEGKGVSAVQLITTSTITFHGDENGNQAFIDIFSCKPYSVEIVLSFINRVFTPKTIKHGFLYRNATSKDPIRFEPTSFPA
jgi:S-adenosylmethionine/arginine decarboxylase-like enzyme